MVLAPLATVASPLWFVRHGETDWNRQGRFVGARDIPLNATGRSQAHRNAETLRGLAAAGLSSGSVRFATSPLRRARQTLTAIRAALGAERLPVIVDRRLRELGFGEWEGLTTAEIKRTSNDARRARKADRWTVAPPGGESYLARVPDVQAFLAEAAAGTVIVAHSGIIRIAAHLIAGTPPAEAARLSVPHEGVLVWSDSRLRWHEAVGGASLDVSESGLFASDDLR